MKNFLAVIGHEIVSLRSKILAIAGFQVFYFIMLYYALPHGNSFRTPPLRLFLMELGSNLFYLFPLLLLFSLYMDSENKTIYQSHSAPIGRAGGLVSKFVVVFLAMIIMYAALLLWVVIYALTVRMTADPRVMAGGYIRAFVGPYIAMCLVVLVWGAIQLVNQYRHLFAVGIAISGFVLYQSILYSNLLIFWNGMPKSLFLIFEQWGIGWLTVTLIIGAVYFLIGIFLYSKYSEV